MMFEDALDRFRPQEEREVSVRALYMIDPMVRRTDGDRSRHLAGVAVAIRTTGPDFRKDHVIELAAQPFLMDVEGRIVETSRLRSWREEPPNSLSAGARRLTGLSDHDMAGRVLPEGEASSIMLDADFIVAANAAYCRPFVHRRLPCVIDTPWSSLLGDVVPQRAGLPEYDLRELAHEMGCLARDRLAETEVTTILHVIDHCGRLARA